MSLLIKSCRLCRSYENINSTLNHIDSDNLSFFQKLNSIAPGILQNDANLPNGVCLNCIMELNIAYKFINKCSESQAIFQRYLEQLQYELDLPSVSNSEVNSNNCITVKDEKESGFLNEEINEKYKVNDYANDDSESDQNFFENGIKIEEEIRNVHAIHKNENIEENCNDSADYIQTDQRGKEVKLENNYSLKPFEELEHDDDDSEFTKTEDYSDSINMNNEYEFIDVKNVEIDEDDIDISKESGHFTGSDLGECDVAKGNKVKYDLKLERLAKVINKEHTKNVDKVLERSEIGENSSNININTQASNKYKICEKACNHRSNLTTHKRTRTGEKLAKSYQCAICGRATVCKSALKQHMRVHTKETPFRCETCNNTFTQYSSLKQHMRIHTNEKPFICQTCNKTFTQSSNLKQHMRIHKNEKPFKCETCNKSFTQPCHLKQHIRIHTNEKAYKCETCNKAFSDPSNLKKHIRIHTNEKPFKCKTCSKAFNQSSALKQHIHIHANKKLQ